MTDLRSVPRTHGGTAPVPVEALLASDPELWLTWAPLHESCRGGCDGVCVCDERPGYGPLSGNARFGAEFPGEEDE